MSTWSRACTVGKPGGLLRKRVVLDHTAVLLTGGQQDEQHDSTHRKRLAWSYGSHAGETIAAAGKREARKHLVTNELAEALVGDRANRDSARSAALTCCGTRRRNVPRAPN